MEATFYKYHGTGNDFILFDNRAGKLQLDQQQIAFLCHRRFGIGADGLMLLENDEDCDFSMIYFNSDGKESSMCGNGGRCIVAFARRLGIIDKRARFRAIDGIHTARVEQADAIVLQMQEVTSITKDDNALIMDTGSPHYLTWVQRLEKVDVVQQGRAIRKESRFSPDGINVNFLERCDGLLHVRTYERGVEDETLSCGTGVTAAAIASTGNHIGHFCIPVATPGGMLEVSFDKHSATSAKNIQLKGPATFVFEGRLQIK